MFRKQLIRNSYALPASILAMGLLVGATLAAFAAPESPFEDDEDPSTLLPHLPHHPYPTLYETVAVGGVTIRLS